MTALRVGRIRDPVHGYIAFTSAEAIVLEDPLVQRLRYIRQSAAAHLVFPGMNVNRFEHSLGAMHVASRLFRSALTQAPPSVAQGVLRALEDLVDGQLADRGDEREDPALLNDLEALEQAMRQQGSVGLHLPLARGRVTTLVIEQALRFASLLHDLGHLPFSHDFEITLTHYLRADAAAAERWPNLRRAATDQDLPLHEHVGHALADWLANRITREFTDEHGAHFRRAITRAAAIADDILLSRTPARLVRSEPRDRAARWLHGLIAGEIDADRCDYVLRDATHYGLPGAIFDLDRLVASVSIAERSEPPGNWETVVVPAGVSAAEEFLVARFRLYQWGVYHHRAQQAAVSLRAALHHLLKAQSADVASFLADYDRLLDPSGGVGRVVIEPLVKYDDSWWRERFKGYIFESARSANAPQEARAVADMKAFVYRGPGRRSLWKKATDVPHAALRALNGAVPTSAEQERAWDVVERRLADELGVVIAVLPYRPYRATSTEERPPSRLQVSWSEGQDQRFEPLSQRSAMVESLYEAWQRSIQVLAFAPQQLPAGHTWETLKEAVISELAAVTVESEDK